MISIYINTFIKYNIYIDVFGFQAAELRIDQFWAFTRLQSPPTLQGFPSLLFIFVDVEPLLFFSLRTFNSDCKLCTQSVHSDTITPVMPGAY